MKYLALWLMRKLLARANEDRDSKTNETVKRAYDSMIRSYQHTIDFIKVDL